MNTGWQRLAGLTGMVIVALAVTHHEVQAQVFPSYTTGAGVVYRDYGDWFYPYYARSYSRTMYSQLSGHGDITGYWGMTRFRNGYYPTMSSRAGAYNRGEYRSYIRAPFDQTNYADTRRIDGYDDGFSVYDRGLDGTHYYNWERFRRNYRQPAFIWPSR